MITGGVKTDMRPVGFQGDQTRIPMKTKITSARGGKEVRRDRERCVPNSGRFRCLLFVVGVIGRPGGSDEVLPSPEPRQPRVRTALTGVAFPHVPSALPTRPPFRNQMLSVTCRAAALTQALCPAAFLLSSFPERGPERAWLEEATELPWTLASLCHRRAGG